MKNKMKVCIIGCGSWAAYYSKILSKFLNKVDLYFCSRDIQKAKLCCNMFKGKGYFNDINKAAQDNSIATFMIFTPHNVHLENVRALANNHKYILLQKPIAGSLSDAKEILSLCNEKKIELMIAENFRFMPAVKIAKKILDSKILGNPNFVYIQEVSSYVPSGWRTNAKQMGGGVLIDLGIHYLSMLRYLLGEPVEVFASLPGLQSCKIEGESAISLLVKMEGGICCSVNLAWGLPFYSKTAQIVNITCEKGSIDIKPQSRFLNLCVGKNQKKVFLGFGEILGHRALLKEFIHRAENKLPIILNSQTGLADLAFVKIAYESLREGKNINASEFFLENELSIP